MRPLRLKSSAYPVDTSNMQGLQEMTDSDIEQYLSAVLTAKFAADYTGTLTGDLNVSTNNAQAGADVGTFVDSIRTESIGTHPATGATSSTTYYVKQANAAVTENITNRLVGYDETTNVGINEFTDNQLDTDVLDKVLDDMVNSAYACGLYSLNASSPSGGTWTSRITLTNTTLSGNNSAYIWQKTSPNSGANSNLRPLKVHNTSDIKEMSDAEIEQMLPNLRNRIIDTGVGTYKLQTSSPSTGGTWVQMGDAGGHSDTRQQVSGQAYSGNYQQSYSGTYASSFTGSYSGTYATNWAGAYAGSYAQPVNYSGAYSRGFTGSYSGGYAGTVNYAGNYSGSYTGTYILYYAGVVYGYFAGTYAGTYTGYYAGTVYYTGAYAGTYTGTFGGVYTGYLYYTGSYTGYYTGYYTGIYAGTYTSYYTGAYTATYTGAYTGTTVLGSVETVNTVKLWLRTA